VPPNQGDSPRGTYDPPPSPPSPDDAPPTSTPSNPPAADVTTPPLVIEPQSFVKRKAPEPTAPANVEASGDAPDEVPEAFSRKRLSFIPLIMDKNDSEGDGAEKAPTLPHANVGFSSNKGVNKAAEVVKINQDRGLICNPLGDPVNQMALFCVFDGHGTGGEHVSQFAARRLPELVARHPVIVTDPAKALSEGLTWVDEELKASEQIEAARCGCTAVAVLYVGGPQPRLIAANLGDSRCVVAQAGADSGAVPRAFALTADQKPNDPQEKARIEGAGGFVSLSFSDGEPSRVYTSILMSGQGLAVARSVGDHEFSDVGVCAEPVVSELVLERGRDEFVVLASDGIWDMFSSDEAVAFFAPKTAGPKHMCDAMLHEANARWEAEEGDEYRDDCTVVYVKLW